MAQQEGFELLPHLRTRVDRILARSSQIANRLVGRIRNPHRAQFSGAGELGQAHDYRGGRS